MTFPKLSIITPSFNQGEFLEATIQSVLNQKYPNLEYIIIDGGSTDESAQIIKKYESHLTYWVSEKDKGQTDAINKGILKSTGDILGWINSDDIYMPGAFNHVIRAFQTHSDCSVVHGDRILIDRHSNVVGWTFLPPFNPMQYGFNVCSETAFWKRNAMDKVGILKTNLRFAMDLEFFCRLYSTGSFIKLDEYLGCFRCYAENKSSTIGHIGREETDREWKRIFGPENENWKILPPANRSAHRLALLKHPMTIGLPYLKHRLTK